MTYLSRLKGKEMNAGQERSDLALDVYERMKVICFFLGFLLLACQPNEHRYYWQSIRIRGAAQFDTTHTTIVKTALRKGYTIAYQTSFDTIEYIRDTVANRLLFRKHSYAAFDTLWHLESQSYLVKGRSYPVERFRLPTASSDSGANFYWCDELGMFFRRASFWPEYAILQSSDEDLNQRIWLLVKASYLAIKKQLYSNVEMMGSEPLVSGREPVIDSRY
ncbi:hypothetical protein [Siphonobacter sp. BAB-5385]|uniref:hypothetical protein n=1 Tax=Siphonobacter sp. BAB-5385 TaxID=1864822 RepID=UPI00113FD91A|nr:hypothetical protein [Siphonobacter sp. BAB-5385]